MFLKCPPGRFIAIVQNYFWSVHELSDNQVPRHLLGQCSIIGESGGQPMGVGGWNKRNYFSKRKMYLKICCFCCCFLLFVCSFVIPRYIARARVHWDCNILIWKYLYLLHYILRYSETLDYQHGISRSDTATWVKRLIYFADEIFNWILSIAFIWFVFVSNFTLKIVLGGPIGNGSVLVYVSASLRLGDKLSVQMMTQVLRRRWPLLLTCFNFNASMDKQLNAL